MKKIYFLVLSVLPFFALSQVTPIEVTSDITVSLSGYTGATEFPGEGEYFIFKSADDILDKPIFLIDGFDPGDTRDIDAVYASLNYPGTTFTNLGDEARAQGFDIVVLNFPTYDDPVNMGATVDGGADFIERNALTLVKLIQLVNTEKAMASSAEENVIIGPSMGGLISRYALNYMEANMLDADTRLWISFDAPHLGANVPIGIQHQFNYLAYNDLQEVVEVQPIVDGVLNSSAARQLLVDHFEPHLLSSSIVDFDPALTQPIPHPYRVQFETNINGFNATGFPTNVRKVAITNGSGEGNLYKAKDGTTDVIPGFEIVDTTIPIDGVPFLGTVNVDININMTPTAGTAQQVSRFFAPLAPPFIPNALSVANSGTTNFDGVDAAPGGLFDLSGLAGDIPMTGLAADFLNALTIDKFSFIPTVSALALEITDEAADDDINWFHDIDLTTTRATTNTTPFDNTYLATDNEDHVALNNDNVAFARSEIFQTSLATNDAEISSFQLERNPIENNLVLLSNTNQDASVSVFDLTGKLVFNSNISLQNRTTIPVNLNTGFYVLNLRGENNRNFTTKFMVR